MSIVSCHPARALLLVALLSASCADAPDAPAPTPTRLSAAPLTRDLAVGWRAPLQVWAHDDAGATWRLTTPLTWESDAPEIAQIAGDEVVALAPGHATLRATAGALSAYASVEVIAGEPRALRFVATDLSLGLHEQRALSVEARVGEGAWLDVTELVTLTSSAPALLRADSARAVRALAPGAAQIEAKLGALSVSAPVRVRAGAPARVVVEVAPLLAPGARVARRATALYGDGTRADVSAAARWEVEGDALVIDGQSHLRADAAGASMLRAMLPGAPRAEARVLVREDALATLRASAPQWQAAPGEARWLGLSALTAQGSVVDMTRAARWQVVQDPSSPCVVVSQAPGEEGRALALRAPCQAQIVARVGALEARVSVEVQAQGPGVLQLEPLRLRMPARTALPVQVRMQELGGRARDVSDQVRFQVDPPQLATVRRDAWRPSVVRARAPGQGTLTATLGAWSATVALEVTDAKLEAITITPERATLRVGEENQCSATGIFDDGSAAYITREITWESDAPEVVEALHGPPVEGVVRALGPGQARVRARSGQVVGELVIEVVGAP